MDIKELLKELKKGIIDLVKEKFDVETKELKTEISGLLIESKEKLERWSILLQNEQLTIEDFEWLVGSQRDLLQLETLRKIGVSQVKLGHFKSKVIKFIVETTVKFVL
jgi:hypothetical protein